MRIGDPDGHGHYGRLDTDLDGRLICHECGRSYQQLATHLHGAHGITAAQYRQEHGLGRRTRLVAANARQHMRDAYDQHRAQHLADLDRSRNPTQATRASLPGAKPGVAWRPEVRAKRQALARARRSRTLTPAETARLTDDLDLQAWTGHARQVLTDRTVSTRSIADACNIPVSTVQTRLRRFPARQRRRAPRPTR